MIRFWLTGCLVAISLPTLALAQATPRRIEVHAAAEVIVPADELSTMLEIATSGKEVAAVKERNDLLLKQVFELLAAQKLSPPPLNTTTVSFNFADNGRRSYPAPKGQLNQAPSKEKDPFGGPAEESPPVAMSRLLPLTFTGLPQATELLAKLAALDAVHKSREIRIGRLHPGLKDPATPQSKARRQAVQQCQEKAALLAEASGLTLGAAVSIYDQGSSRLPSSSYSSPDSLDPFGSDPFGDLPEDKSIVFTAFQPKKAATDPDKIPPGHVRISASVRIIYEAAQVE